MAQEKSTLRDEALAAQALDGDEAAFELLFERHFDRIFAMAYRLCGTREDARDIAQETFVRAARSLDSFREDAPFRAWLSRICINAVRGWQRRLIRQRSLLEEYHRRLHTRTQDDLRAKEVLEALDELPQQEREAVVLTVIEGYSHRDCAQIIGKAESTVSWRVFRAKKRLRALFTEVSDE